MWNALEGPAACAENDSRMLVGSLILAGGRSRRMGKPKESLAFADGTLLGHITELLLQCTWPVVVVSRDTAQELPPLPLESILIHDDKPLAGPLVAIASGMRHVHAGGGFGEQDALFVTGCDAPFLSERAVGWLASQLGDHQAVMPRTDGTLQPLCAVYRLSCLPVIDDLLRSGVETARTIAEKVNTRILDDDILRDFDTGLQFLRSVNTPEEYEEACRTADSSQ